MIVKAKCPCCGEEYYIEFDVKALDSEKLLSVKQVATADESKILHDVYSSIVVKNGVEIEKLKECLNKKFGIAFDSTQDIVESIKDEFGMYKEKDRLYFKK